VPDVKLAESQCLAFNSDGILFVGDANGQILAFDDALTVIASATHDVCFGATVALMYYRMILVCGVCVLVTIIYTVVASREMPKNGLLTFNCADGLTLVMIVLFI